MWLPRWLGELYARVYVNFGAEPFTFAEAVKLLGQSREKLSIAFSRLHAARVLFYHSRARPRLYRVLKPESLLYLASGAIKNLDKIKQERYLQLISDVAIHLIRDFEVEALCIYGSIARGTARLDSDLDILAVSDSFSGSLASRVEALCEIEEMVSDELKRLRRYEVHTGLSILPLRRGEVERFPLILLDVTVDGIIIHDRNGFLERTLSRLRGHLAEIGARRVAIGKNAWYWDLRPGFKAEEVAGSEASQGG